MIPLHGSLSAEEQRSIFDSVRPGERKVILATNVAETSLTVPDVTDVVDTGHVREMRKNKLETVWVSQAS